MQKRADIMHIHLTILKNTYVHALLDVMSCCNIVHVRRARATLRAALRAAQSTEYVYKIRGVYIRS